MRSTQNRVPRGVTVRVCLEAPKTYIPRQFQVALSVLTFISLIELSLKIGLNPSFSLLSTWMAVKPFELVGAMNKAKYYRKCIRLIIPTVPKY